GIMNERTQKIFDVTILQKYLFLKILHLIPNLPVFDYEIC
ncbi:24820_t:CDS:2, partial [Racocetra persica]